VSVGLDRRVRMGTPAGRGIIAAAALGSSLAFLDSTVVNVALPAIAADLDAGVTGLQWTLDAYLVTLSALLLLGGSLGDLYGRRQVFLAGLAGFTVASMLCGFAPTTPALVVARGLQGVAAALLVPGSLAIISATFHPDDRGAAVGAWSGLTGVSTAVGPFLGGWLIDAASWRWIFFINLPVAVAAVLITRRWVPETRGAAGTRPDVGGALAASIGLGAVAFALIEGPGDGAWPWVAGVAGVVALVVFVVLQRRVPSPMLPLGLFASRQFTGANLTTLAVYAGLGGALFLVVLQLQTTLGYSALEAGAALVPITGLMLVLSARAGALAQRIGARPLMTAGPAIMAVGLVLFAQIEPGTSYWTGVLPAATVFGLGLATTVAPLTAAVLAAVDEEHLGVGSGVNNAVARVAGLFAVAVLPGVTGITDDLADGYPDAMHLSAVVCVAGAAVAFATIRRTRAVEPAAVAAVDHPCHDPCLAAPA
jgi:EmrB/QacA subfamily drug resistance transporter